ncbi:MAG TPA: glycosyltransferase, partial [Thermomicrobiales bacterium]|nr:glycosyltransferase [Thermomicrobiales bacterium]
LATTYQGEALESLWWQSIPNPCQTEGEVFRRLKAIAARRQRQVQTARTEEDGESLADRATRVAAQRWIRPRWRRHLERTIERHRDIDAILVLTVPLNQLAGLPGYLRRRYGIPVWFYDGDVPASLPSFAGFQSGFRIYQGADLAEYDGFLSNSQGGAAELLALGARRVDVLYYGADPEVFSPVPVAQDLDVFFYGHGYEYRREWIEAMLTAPSEALAGARFALRGTRFDIDLGTTERLPYLSFSKLREYCCRSKINLNITRKAHASVPASSTSRPFELAALGCCIVSNPYEGIEEWFEPGRELFVVHGAEEATETYRWLLAHDDERRRVGERARQRLLAEHTFRHRAQQLLTILRENGVAATSPASALAGR